MPKLKDEIIHLIPKNVKVYSKIYAEYEHTYMIILAEVKIM